MVKGILVKANQRKNGDKVSPVARANLIFVSIVQGPHTLALYAQLQTSDDLEMAVGESGIFLRRECRRECRMSNVSTPFSQPFESREHQTTGTSPGYHFK